MILAWGKWELIASDVDACGKQQYPGWRHMKQWFKEENGNSDNPLKRTQRLSITIHGQSGYLQIRRKKNMFGAWAKSTM